MKTVITDTQLATVLVLFKDCCWIMDNFPLDPAVIFQAKECVTLIYDIVRNEQPSAESLGRILGGYNGNP